MHIEIARKLADRIQSETGLENLTGQDAFWGNGLQIETLRNGASVFKIQWAPYRHQKDSITDFRKFLDKYDLFCVNPTAGRIRSRYAQRRRT